MANIVGPSYTLNTRKADVQRAVNLFPVINETKSGKSVAYLDSVPGMNEFSTGITELGVILLESGGKVLQENGAYIYLET